jgi:hypothetical protein
MVTSAIWFNLSMLWRAVRGSIWGSVLLFTFPIRFFASIPRERLLQELKEENLQLMEVNGKDYRSKKGKVKPSEEPSEIRSIHKPKNIPYASKGKAEFTSVKSPLYPFAKSTIPKDEELTPRVLGLEKNIAVSRSVFSAMLALVVGIVMYEAKEQELCTPLIGALFTVVGISLKSVVQFFSTVKNKPALDAVALMSLNWFIVGTLTYPTLPRVARIVVPRVFNTVGSVFALLHGGSLPSPPEFVNYVG